MPPKHVDCEEFLRVLKAHTLESDNRSAEARPDSLIQLSVKTN
jgi:hypothetical protein